MTFTKYTFLILLSLLSIRAIGQSPYLINYQAIARSSSGNILVDQPISIRLTIHTDSAGGGVQYQETQSATTNTYGLFNLQIGAGTVISGAMSTVSWDSGAKYLQVEFDPTGGTSYVNMGTQQFVSIPYALYAKNAGVASQLSGNIAIAGDVTGLNPATTVVKIQGKDVSPTAPLSGQVLQWDGTTWQPSNPNLGTVTSVTAGTGLTGGTITSAGTIGMPNVGIPGTYGSAAQVPVFTTDLEGRVISVTNTPIGGVYTAGTGVSISGTVIAAENTSDIWNADKIQGINVSTVAPTTGQVLQYNSGVWSPSGLPVSWSISGNSGTTPSSNFLGTTDMNALQFRVNDIWAGQLDPLLGNTSLGINAGMNVTSGYSNIAIGISALYSNNVSTNLVAVGDSAMYNQNGGYGNNVAVGSKALFTNTTGNNSTAIGMQTLFSNTTGYQNSALGLQALYSNTTGFQNIASGTESLYSNTTGSDNTAYGSGTLQSNTTGSYNVASGVQSLYLNTTAASNTAYGYASMFATTTGGGNTAVGRASLYTNTTGSDNTAIGYNADVSSGSLMNATAIGYGAIVNSSNKIVIGNASVATIGGYQNWTNLSDGRFKKNIQENVPGLEFIMKLRPVTYQFEARKFEHFLGKPDSIINQSQDAYTNSEAQIRTGFVAQDVEKAANEVGYNFSGIHKPANEQDNYSLAYAEFTVPLVKAVQQQQQTIDKLKKEVDELMKKVDELQKQLPK